VSTVGDVSMNGTELSFGGYRLTAASLAMGDSGLSVTGLVNVPVFGVVQFTGVFGTSGDYALKTELLENRELLGGVVELEAPVVTITPSGAKLDAHATVTGVGHAGLEGILTFDGSDRLTGKGGVALGPLSYDDVEFTVGSAEVGFSIPVPSIGDIAFRGSYAPDGT
jgi:hypothetical protein